MAVPTFVAAGALGSSTTTLTPGAPAGLAANHAMLMFVESQVNQNVTLSSAQGFVELPDSPQNANIGGGPRLHIFGKRAVGGDTMPTIADPGDHIIAAILAWSGCRTTGNFYDVTSGGAQQSGPTTAISIPGDTTTVPDCLVVGAVASGRGNSNDFSAYTNADLTAITERLDAGATPGGATNGNIGVFEGAKAVAGAYGATAVTQAGVAYQAYVTITLAAGAAPSVADFAAATLDEVSLFQVVLSPATILGLYNAGVGTSTFDLMQRSFRFRNDDGTEATATWKAAQNTNISQVRDTNLRIRFEVQEAGGSSGATTAQLQYSKNGAAFANVTAASTNVRSSASPNVADGTATTDQLALGTGTFAAGTFDEVDGAVASVTLVANGHTEVEFCVQIRSADVAVGDTIDLQLTLSGDATPTYAASPSIVVVSALAQVEQKAFRIRNDDGDEASATWKAAQNTNASAFLDTNLRLRFEIQETAAGSGAVSYQLQSNKNGAGYVNVDVAATNVRPASSSFLNDDAALTNQLTAGTGTYVPGRFDEIDGIAGGDPLVSSGHTEIEFCVQLRSVAVANGDTVQFRVVPSGEVTGSTTYTATPTVTAQSIPLPTISGFTPSHGLAGSQVVVITGTNFNTATSVTFNGVTASFVIDLATQITATCPVSATTGVIRVLNLFGTAISSTDFTVDIPPPSGGVIAKTGAAVYPQA